MSICESCLCLSLYQSSSRTPCSIPALRQRYANTLTVTTDFIFPRTSTSLPQCASSSFPGQQIFLIAIALT